jgi:hypothetical protein
MSENPFPNDSAELSDPDAHKPDETATFLDAPQPNSDPKLLQRKRVTDKSKELKEEGDLLMVLSTPEGLRFMVRLFGICGLDQPVFHPSNSVMCEIAGRRQIANQLRNWIKDAGLEQWFRVEQEFEKSRAKPKTSERAARR